MTRTSTVVAIPPSYESDGTAEVESTSSYLDFLTSRGIDTVMSTAGTSQFNLLSYEEIHQFNAAIASSDAKKKILGVPPCSLRDALKFTNDALKYCDSSCRLMLLFPDRYYDDKTIISYISSVSDAAGSPVYIHCMPMRKGTGGTWDYTSYVINDLHSKGVLEGIKEEHTSLKKSYDFVGDLNSDIDVIVAGGSMRRHQFLKSAGANSFLSGIGNLIPKVELDYVESVSSLSCIQKNLELETSLFSVFMKYGWHPSLRYALRHLNLTCKADRQPWPDLSDIAKEEIEAVVGLCTKGALNNG